MPIDVVPYSGEWPGQFSRVASRLREVLDAFPSVKIEHVGSTAVPGLAAKPILDIDVIVLRELMPAVLASLETAGYVHLGDLGVTDREALQAPDSDPHRNVYVCVGGTLHLRNHLAVRDALRATPKLRDRYGAVKLQLAQDPDMDIPNYLAGKSAVLQEVLAASASRRSRNVRSTSSTPKSEALPPSQIHSALRLVEGGTLAAQVARDLEHVPSHLLSQVQRTGTLNVPISPNPRLHIIQQP